MSVKYILQAMESSVGSSARKLVLIKLADNANDEGSCYPSYQNIADHCEMTKRSVMTHIRKLEEDGFIKVENRKTKKGNSSNLFTLITKVDKLSLPSENISPPSENISPPPSENISPRTCHSFEPVKEPSEFDLFWNEYPVKSSKPQALKSWNRLSDSDRKKAHTRLQNFIDNLPDFQKPVRLHASTYLNNKRWEDEPQNNSVQINNGWGAL